MSPSVLSFPRLTGLLVVALACGVVARAEPAVARIFDVRAQGATGDGRTVDTDAINRTILAATATGGGTVLFPPGTYLSASIRLKSNITLWLEAGATIEAVDAARALYDLPEKELNLIHLMMSLIVCVFPVEAFRTPKVPDTVASHTR